MYLEGDMAETDAGEIEGGITCIYTGFFVPWRTVVILPYNISGPKEYFYAPVDQSWVLSCLYFMVLCIDVLKMNRK